jgi:phosphoribosylanthranilate isomerase
VLRENAPLPDELPPRLLYEGAVSGAGRTADWSRAEKVARRAELLLAGGLDADNVAAAIRAVRPFGVDVSSGVESSQGVKCPTKIARFVAAARAAAQS